MLVKKLIVTLWRDGQAVPLDKLDRAELSDNDPAQLWLIDGFTLDGSKPELHVCHYRITPRSVPLWTIEKRHQTNLTMQYGIFYDDRGNQYICGDTADKVECLPIPCPKVRKGITTKFMGGEWHKLVSNQWVALNSTVI